MASNKSPYKTLEETATTLAEANAKHWEEHRGTGIEHQEYLKALDDVLCMMALSLPDSRYTPVRSLLYQRQKDAP